MLLDNNICRINVCSDDYDVVIQSIYFYDLTIIKILNIDVEFNIDKLSQDATKIYFKDNAGGASKISECLSMEFLNILFGAKLIFTECELKYVNEMSFDVYHGPITDFSINIDGYIIGVSVTRAINWNDMFDKNFADRLLIKKLNGIKESTKNCITCNFYKQILHIWTNSSICKEILLDSYYNLSDEIKGNTIVLISICKNCDIIFNERNPTPIKGSKRYIKGTKDINHLKILEQSMPRSIVI